MANIEDKTENEINNKIEIETQNKYIENQYIQNDNKINNELEIETQNEYIENENENEYNPFEIRIDSKHVVCVMISSQMETFVGDVLYVSYFYKL